jgi:hypothetical protein
MRKLMVVLSVCCVVFFFASIVVAAEESGPVQTVVKGCEKEINTYCKAVTPGKGRVLACLYAYEDKLSNRCEYALYDAAAQLQRFITGINYLATECRDDLKTYCSGVKPGEGRLLECIDKNMAKVSGRCKQAIQDVKLK